mmetsp:Transcript_73236/g.134190  ORF Transcript_73236/g.134190 Transcript_73236/m.134190 type:complete len:235 (+) Transcript_73236:849-1553(+)
MTSTRDAASSGLKSGMLTEASCAAASETLQVAGWPCSATSHSACSSHSSGTAVTAAFVTAPHCASSCPKSILADLLLVPNCGCSSASACCSAWRCTGTQRGAADDNGVLEPLETISSGAEACGCPCLFTCTQNSTMSPTLAPLLKKVLRCKYTRLLKHSYASSLSIQPFSLNAWNSEMTPLKTRGVLFSEKSRERAPAGCFLSAIWVSCFLAATSNRVSCSRSSTAVPIFHVLS